MQSQYFLYFFLLSTVFWISCEDFEDPNLDFSNSQPQYVELSSGSTIQTNAGEQVSIRVRVRENMNTDVNIDYSVSGDISTSGSVTISEGDLSTDILVTIPADIATGTASVELTGVDNGLQLGRGGPSSGLSAISRMIAW